MSTTQENEPRMPEQTEQTDTSKNMQPIKVEDKFYAASKKWRKQINYLQCQIVNRRNKPLLEKESRVLKQCMKELTAAQEELENSQDSFVERMTLYGKFEDISRETNKMLIQVGETICDLKSRDDFDKYSVISTRSNRSVASRKSQRSKSSRGSLASTSSSARQRRLDLEEQIATLTVKMDMVHEREEIDKANRYALDEIEQRKLQLQNEDKRLMRDIGRML